MKYRIATGITAVLIICLGTAQAGLSKDRIYQRLEAADKLLPASRVSGEYAPPDFG